MVQIYVHAYMYNLHSFSNAHIAITTGLYTGGDKVKKLEKKRYLEKISVYIYGS